MLIACEKCSTTYVLDDSLIPPAGAPVQCTRCDHIFVARLTGNEPTAAPPPPPKPSVGNSTMMFGTPASNARKAAEAAAPVPPPNATMVFGKGPAAPEPAPAKNQTMMFGTPASNAASAQAAAAAAGAPASASKQTMVFGMGAAPTAPSPAPAPAPPQKNQTMMFGSPVSAAAGGATDETLIERPSTRPGTSTVIFGAAAVQAPAEPAAAKNQTMMFGKPAIPKVTPGTAELAGYAGTEDVPAENTPQKAPPDAPAPAAAANRTQLFAMSSSPAVLEPSVAVVEDAARTVIVADATLPAVEPQAPLQKLGTSEMVAEALEERLASVQLPPEPEGPTDATEPAVEPDQLQAAIEDEAAMRAAQSSGAGRIIVIILSIVALVLAGVLISRLLGRGLLGSAAPVEALRTTDVALATLRLDDRVSQDKAVAQLQAVLKEHPGLAETQGALVVASAMRFDDVQGQLTQAIATVKALKSNDGAAHRIEQFEKSIAELKLQSAEMKARLAESLAALESLVPGIQAGTPTHLSVLRAEGLARGVLGDGVALTRAVAYRQLTQVSDDWVDLIEPEYALNGGTALDAAIVQLRAVKGRGSNSTFLRPYVLLARLQLKNGDLEEARQELEQVITMNSRHEVAKGLLANLTLVH